MRRDDQDPPELPPHGNFRPSEPYLPCCTCHAPTPYHTLEMHGARCLRCYDAYLRQPRPAPDIGDKRIGPRSWAHALQRRDIPGAGITQAQRNAYRAALAHLEPEQPQ